ncbi:type II secretion system F family protein [Aliiroseovarius sp.]|uniref:type II secretion system F family protein n=1 Tax=Aliiroseovarius sp. TaxID=1872442 RepID=UPI0026309592|nr:type II secretion system F family protein [Aliiroseovarius sp.]
MFELITEYMNGLASQPETILIAGLGIGVVLVTAGVMSLTSRRSVAAARMAAATRTRRQARQDRGLLQSSELDPRGVMKSFFPADAAKRSALQKRLAQAGYPQPGVLGRFLLARVTMAILFPAVLLALLTAYRLPGITLPPMLGNFVGGLSHMQTVLALIWLVLAGYFVPVFWLNNRVSARMQRVEEGFPNALDLLRISVEAGLGFDAAMTRVGNELATVSPDIAFEFLTVQRQVQAGLDRGKALNDMADRTGVDIVSAFANVVQQSIQFGTNMSDALTTHADELRTIREVKAQEMANKLPVKMSAVLASLMLPALILLTIGPVLIRYIRYFGG